MGLDMYLTAKRYLWNGEDDAIGQKIGEAIGIKGDPENRFRGCSLVVKGIELDAMYWRKANAIHGWFVDHCQDGEDDCREYEVDREQLEELRDLCSKILKRHEDMKTMSEDELEELEEIDGEESLEPTEGFFFGSTEKDEWYYQDLRDTVEGLTKCLELPKNYYFIYRSSW